MKDWTITDSSSMYNSYDKETFKGVGDPVGHNVRILTIRNIQIDVWGHDEGKEETERIANMIVSLPSLKEEINQLRQAVLIYKEADFQSVIPNSILTNDQQEFVNAAMLINTEVENPLR